MKMQRIVVCSDVHGFYDELIKALDEVNFNPEKDLFISLGDNIDRGPKPQEVIDFMLSLPNKVLVKGNHSTLFEECCKRSYPLSYDWHNGTADSILSLAPDAKNWDGACLVAMEKMNPLLNQMVDYFETKHYIFCHGYLPTHKNPKKGFYELDPDWRYAHASDWEDARWLNGMKMAMDGCDPGKCVVVGHYHASYGHAIQDRTFDEWGTDADFSPFYYEDKLIAIDACTAHTGFCNVIVLEDNLLNI